jgi:hypothetical protein
VEGENMNKRIVPWIVPAAWITLSIARSAHAYIDPGTGSYVLQTALAIVFAVAYATKIHWRNILGFCRARFGRKGPEEKLEN